MASFIQTEQVVKMLAVQGVEVVTEGPGKYESLIAREIEQYARLVKLTGAKIEN